MEKTNVIYALEESGKGMKFFMIKIKKKEWYFHVFAIFLILVLGFAVTPVIFQNDTFYTIKIGELIWKNGIDMKDHFSWHSNLPYTYPHWAYDLIIYGIYNIFGFTGIYISTVILAVILGITIYITNCKLSKNKTVSLIISLLVIYLLRDYITARAQLVTYILFVLTHLFIEQFIETKKKKYLVFLLIIPLIIANMHVAVWPFYFVLFMPCIAEYLIYHIRKIDLFTWIKIQLREIQIIFTKQSNTEKFAKIEEKIQILKQKKLETELKIKNRRDNPYKIQIENNKGVKWLIGLAVIAILTGFFTPLKEVPYTYLLKTMQGSTVKNISEHLPLILIDNKELLVTFSIFLAILILLNSKIKLRDFCMVGGLVLLSFMSRRHAALFIIISSPILAKLIVNVATTYKSKIFNFIEKFFNNICGKMVVISVILLCSVLLLKPKLKHNFIDKDTYPIEAANFIIQNLDLAEIRLYNEYNFGSYLIFRDTPVFIDSRADLYAPEFNGKKNETGKFVGRDIFMDFINISQELVHYENGFSRYGITHVLINRYSKINLYIREDKNYEILYQDNNFVLYKRDVSDE